MNHTVGLIGLGAMGKALANKMLENGASLSIWNRTAKEMDSYYEKDVFIASDSKELIERSDVIILMLTDALAINDVLKNTEKLSGKTIIQMGTISPSDSILLSEKITNKDGVYFEAPVLGSIPDINAGKLIIMLGGTEKNLENWRWLFNLFGPKPLLIGAVGDAATLKLAMNQLIGSLTCAFSSSLSLILKKSIDLDIFMEIVRDSALYAPTYDKKLEKMLNNDFKNGNFSTKHLLKDLNFFIKEAQESDINTATVESVRDITQETINKGMKDDDYSSLFSIINKTDD